jgi:protein-L-isoaspartate(D-aspartate) O-methyltransferase
VRIYAAGIDHIVRGDCMQPAAIGPPRRAIRRRNRLTIPRDFPGQRMLRHPLVISLYDVIKVRTLCDPTPEPLLKPMNLEAARTQMVEQQVRAWDVLDERVLQTMLQVQREQFAPSRYRDVAFADAAIPLVHGQMMLPAKVHGRILQALAIGPGDLALEVGAGSGYLSACLGKLAARVRSLEIFPDLAELARANLLAARVNNVSVEVTDALQLNEPSSYDVIAVTGSLPIYDERFQQALRLGGRLFVVVGSPPIMEAWQVVRVGEREWQRQALFETVIEPLVNAPRPSSFVF